MKSISISINPTYNCNFNCDFCYLNGFNTQSLLDLNKLKDQLKEVSTKYIITSIDIYGGQIFLLQDSYLKQLFNTCFVYVQNIYLITNMSITKAWIFEHNNIIISASWDYIYRPQNQIILNNIKDYIKTYKKNISIILTHPNLYSHKKQIVNILNSTFKQDINISLKPYYKTNNTDYNINFQNYQKFFLYLYSNLNANFNILIEINDKSTQHIFISPNNQLQTISYNSNLQQYFTNYLDQEETINCICCTKYKNCLKQHKFLKTNYDCCGQYKLLNKLDQLNKPHFSWKNRRKLYYLTTQLNDINLPYTYNYDNIEKQVIQFFYSESKLVYPAKSYYVAIIYAYLLSEYFGQDFYEMLNRQDLLNYDDKHFITYLNDKQTYDIILKEIYNKLSTLDISDTSTYFYKEFLIKELI